MNNPRYSTETIADSRLAAAQPPWPRPAVLRLLELQPGAPGCYRFIRDVPVDAPAILFCGGIKKWNPEFAEESAEATARLFHSLLLRCDVPPDAVRLIVVTGATPDYPRQRTDERRRYNLSPYTFTGAAGDLAAGLVRSLLDGVDDAATAPRLRGVQRGFSRLLLIGFCTGSAFIGQLENAMIPLLRRHAGFSPQQACDATAALAGLHLAPSAVQLPKPWGFPGLTAMLRGDPWIPELRDLQPLRGQGLECFTAERRLVLRASYAETGAPSTAAQTTPHRLAPYFQDRPPGAGESAALADMGRMARGVMDYLRACLQAGLDAHHGQPLRNTAGVLDRLRQGLLNG